jgi:hypothetical protein
MAEERWLSDPLLVSWKIVDAEIYDRIFYPITNRCDEDVVTRAHRLDARYTQLRRQMYDIVRDLNHVDFFNAETSQEPQEPEEPKESERTQNNPVASLGS